MRNLNKVGGVFLVAILFLIFNSSDYEAIEKNVQNSPVLTIPNFEEERNPILDGVNLLESMKKETVEKSTREVKTWNEFVQAFKDDSVERININQEILVASASIDISRTTKLRIHMGASGALHRNWNAQAVYIVLSGPALEFSGEQLDDPKRGFMFLSSGGGLDTLTMIKIYTDELSVNKTNLISSNIKSFDRSNGRPLKNLNIENGAVITTDWPYNTSPVQASIPVNSVSLSGKYYLANITIESYPNGNPRSRIITFYSKESGSSFKVDGGLRYTISGRNYQFPNDFYGTFIKEPSASLYETNYSNLFGKKFIDTISTSDAMGLSGIARFTNWEEFSGGQPPTEPEVGSQVKVLYHNTKGEEISTSRIFEGSVGSPYQTEAKEIPKYKLKTTPNNANGIFTSTLQTVIYVYEKIKGAPVIVKYQDESGKELVKEDILVGDLDDFYETKAKEIPNYKLKTTPSNAKGQFTTTVQTVTYVYEKVEGAPVTVKYQDETGKELATSEMLKGYIGDPYESKAKEIPNYKLKITPNNAKGQFTATAQTVTYVYEKAEGAPVTVKYQDETGKELATSETLKGYLGDPYESKAKEIPNYKLKTTPNNAKGQFTATAQTVIYVYEKIKGAPVTVEYQDESGKELAKDDIYEGYLGDPYETKAKAIRNYKLKTTPNNANGVYKETTQTVVYVYEKRESKIETDGEITMIPGGNEISVIPPVADPQVSIPAITVEDVPLKVAYAPKISFGRQELPATDHTYNMLAERHSLTTSQENVPYVSFIQVQDVRGTHQGWTLSVTSSEFVDLSSDSVLVGANLIMNNPNVVYQGLEEEAPSSYTGKLELTPNQKFDIMSAKVGTGAGVSSLVYGDQEELTKLNNIKDQQVLNSSIQLFVPGYGMIRSSKYRATLDWDISSVPENQISLSSH